ncbi:hypothetical protein C1T31_02775 [Hanstruepera neustonica]|uniref:Secretion system C-terminal sorting domain-containing protein n=1 Tax=Hanstruepera neustonica TaxID=1445657 RepID=A0A2K1E463_9FLAO|nr:T9SS type A sorting domain-containing protein [Hanstruepera neustonica]PNQ75076.1 hypothetical protein C1T31_02775 [Hanstruepera neustonica]
MKKTTYLLAILIAFQTLTFAQYTAIPDANFEQALITFGYDSEGTLDGQILTADANGASGSLAFAGQNISDITGIEAFINIDGLNMSYNPINVGVDLTSNTLLTSVNFEECNSLPSLTITNLTALQVLNIFGTAITTLDVSTNTALADITARNGSLTSLDLSANTNIVAVNVRNCNLSSLDMRNGNNANVTSFNSDFNSGLTCIFVDDSAEPNLGTWSIDAGSNFVENEAECATLSTTTFKAIAFDLYPNPATDRINIRSKAQNAFLEIFNITGKQVVSKNLGFGDNTINISQLKSGVYLVRLISESNIETKKLIIN